MTDSDVGILRRLVEGKYRPYRDFSQAELEIIMAELLAKCDLKENDIFSIPPGIDPVEFDKAMKAEYERRYGK